MDLTQLLTGFVLSVAASIITAIATVRLSLSRFRSERWWERKADAYSRLIEELALLQINCEWWREEYRRLVSGGWSRQAEEDKLGKRIPRHVVRPTLEIPLFSLAASDAYPRSLQQHRQ